MKQPKALRTFEVRIEQCRNSTWQGNLTTDGYTLEFRSELELLLAMDRLLPNSGTMICPQETAETFARQPKKNGTL